MAILLSTVVLLAGPVQQSSAQQTSVQQEPAQENVAAAPQSEPPTATPPATKPGILVSIDLPVTAESAEQVKAVLEQAINSTQGSNAPNQERPRIVLEFDTRNSKTGQGSDFHACLSLAELLISPRMGRLFPVAYIPAPEGLAPGGDQLDAKPISHLKGHAVLIALACNELAMHNDASIGEAAIDEQSLSRTRIVAYEEIAGSRSVLPTELALSMVDKNRSLFRVEQTDGSIEFVDRQQLESIKADGQLVDSRPLVEEGVLPLLTSQQLAEFRLIDYRVNSRKQLAVRLNVDSETLQFDLFKGGSPQAVQINVNSYVDQRSVNWLLRSLAQQDSDVNLIVVMIDADDGDPFECLRLAEHLAGYDSRQTQTVAYIAGESSGPTSLIALACDDVIMQEKARLGGVGEMNLREETLSDLHRAIKTFADQSDYHWSLFSAFVDPSKSLYQYQHAERGEIVLMGSDEKDEQKDAKSWNSRGKVEVSSGVSAKEAVNLDLAQLVVNDLDGLRRVYQLKNDIPTLQPTAADRWIASLAQSLASPWVAGWLLFGAMFLLSTELSQPGIGIPGFLGTVCLLLFFWSQYFDGNAHWLEIMLFIVGAVFIGLEVFVLPGFGIFGVGGLMMVTASIILATQTFIIPQNSEQFRQLPVSLSMVLAGSAGFFVALAIFRKYMPKTPYFKKMILDPDSEEELVSRSEREAVVNWQHLKGQTGSSLTRLAPTGKARIGSDVVDVITEGRMIDKDQAIKVVEVSGNRVVVRATG